MTVQAFLHRHVLHSNFDSGWIYIDEASLLGVSLLSYLAILTQRPNIRFLVSGDFDQLGPPADVWCETLIEKNNFVHSRLLHTMCGGNHIKLTQSRRSDGALFHFYNSLMSGPMLQLPLADCIHLARAAFPVRSRFSRWNACLSHVRRRSTNEQCYHHYAKGERLQATLCEENVNEIYIGCPLYATNSRKLSNGSFLEVVSWADSVVVRDLETQNETSIPYSDLRFCRLGFACTYQAFQGRTLKESVRLHCLSHPRFTRKHLYVGLSRAVSGDLLSIA